MATVSERLVIDCSLVAKWKLVNEPQAAEAEELLLDWQQAVVEPCAPPDLLSELVSTFLSAHKKGRISESEALAFLGDLLALPFVLHPLTTLLACRAFEIARRHNQRVYDCIYVALAEQEAINFWTADLRLYNALQRHFPFVRCVADYRRQRP